MSVGVMDLIIVRLEEEQMRKKGVEGNGGPAVDFLSSWAGFSDAY